jgi:hypothetical protein
VFLFPTAAPDRGKTIVVKPPEGLCSVFINFSIFMYSYILLLPFYTLSDGVSYLVEDDASPLRQWRVR